MTSLTRQTVSVSLADRSYEIHVGENLLPGIGPLIQNWVEARYGKSPRSQALLITDSNVLEHAKAVEESLTAAGWAIDQFEMQPGEASKRLEVISKIWDQLVDMKADRRTVIVAVGGGVVGDAAGFVAATFGRGVPFAQVPTTLLADVDSSVGGKVGINHPQAKNLIGAFHQPLGVVIDLQVLSTLPEREFRAGLAEVVKYGVILDAEFFEFLEENSKKILSRDAEALKHAIARSCRLKADVVEEDEFERSGRRAALNYGHTFGHAFEALTGYGELLHGEAVSIGMIHASRLAEKRGMISPDVTERQIALLKRLHLPLHSPALESISAKDVIERMLLDKKTLGGQLRFILPTRIGHVDLVSDVAPESVRDVLREGGIQ